MLKSNNFNIEYRIYYEDTDSGGVVYYANYLKFFERARTEFLREKGIFQNELKKNHKILFVVKSCEVNYIKPAELDDVIKVFVKIQKVQNVSIEIEQEIYREGELLTTLNVIIAAIDADNFKPKKINKELKDILVRYCQN